MVAYYLIEVGIAANFKHVWMPHLKQFNHEGDLSRDVWKTRGQLVLSNSHAIFHDPVPCLENVIHVGGLHIKPTKPLPPSLNTFMDNAKQGKGKTPHRYFSFEVKIQFYRGWTLNFKLPNFK